MGSGVSRSQRRKREYMRTCQVADVERFILNSYAAMNRIDGMNAILSAERPRKAFKQFVASEKADDIFKLYIGCNKIISIIKPAPQAFGEDVENLFTLFIKTGADMQVVVSEDLYEDIESYVKLDRSGPDFVKSGKQLLECIMDECVFLMARDQFQRFIVSKYYKQWRAMESGFTLAQGGVYLDPAAQSRTAAEDLPDSQSPSSRARLKSELTLRAFRGTDGDEAGKILSTQSWLAVLLAAIEAVPLAFAIATGDKNRRGFPLVYVNKQFELLTCHNRNTVLGKNCKFMQCAETEPDKIAILTEALKSEKEAMTVITNCTAEGKVFKNLVAIKPVKDERDKLIYVLAIMMDASRDDDGHAARTRLASDLMKMLPNQVFAPDED